MPEKTNITFEILEHIGVISRYDSGWNKELNVISWNGGPAKYDVRDWDAYHERMKRGVTLFDAELRKLVDLYLNNNSQKAVERGRMLEAQRKARRQEQQEQQEFPELQQQDVCEAAEGSVSFESAPLELTESAVQTETETAEAPSPEQDSEKDQEAEAEAGKAAEPPAPGCGAEAERLPEPPASDHVPF